MVIAIIEPIAAGVIVSLLNKYFISGRFYSWLPTWCVEEPDLEDDREDSELGDTEWKRQVSSTTTTVSDASVHVHCH